MPGEEKQAKQPIPLPVTVTLRDIYDRLCPTCRERLLDLFANEANVRALREALVRQLEEKPDVS